MNTREEKYREVLDALASLTFGETDWVTVLSTAACELHHAFDHFHWTGFYRVTGAEMLSVGPYQGDHGCLHIAFSRGVCGRAARTREVQWVRDVHADADHIACSSTTRSEIVVPLVTQEGKLLAVLDVDSNDLDAFEQADVDGLVAIAALLAERASCCVGRV